MSGPLDREADLQRLPPIGLAELNDLAALQTRVDRKYVLERPEADRVLAALDGRSRVLEIDGHRAAAYESVYFDTADLLSYRLAAHGRRRRFKLRTRAYVESSTAFLEMKTRGARSATVKERIEHPWAERARMTAAGREYAASAFRVLGIDQDRADDLRPVLVTRYRRTTILQPGAAGRATFDTHLAWERVGGPAFRLPTRVIVETKSGTRPSPVDRLLWSHGLRPATVSKYGTGLAALDPALPSTKWSRTLRRHFSD